MPNRLGEQIGAVPVPQIKEEVSERTQHAHFGREAFEKGGRKYFDCEDPKDLVMHPPLTPIDQPGDQACRDPADSIHRQDWRHACGDAATSPSDSDAVADRTSPAQPGDQACRYPAEQLHRQGCRCACGDGTTGPSDSDCAQDWVCPVDQPGDQACQDAADSKTSTSSSRWSR